MSNERPADRSRCEAPRPVRPVGKDARPSNGKPRVRVSHRPPRVLEKCVILPCHTLAPAGPTVKGYQERTGRKAMQVRVLPLLHTRDRNERGMKLTASTTTPTTTPCLTGADGRGLSPFKREALSRVRTPASSTTTHGPERLGYRLETPQPRQLARATGASRRRSSVWKSTAQFLRRTPALVKGRRRRIIENVEVAVSSTTPAVSTRRADAAWLSLPPVPGQPARTSRNFAIPAPRSLATIAVSPGRTTCLSD